MTRPDVEGILRDNGDVPPLANLCHYVLAMEAAQKIVMGCQHPPGDGPSFDCTRCAFDAAVARWTP